MPRFTLNLVLRNATPAPDARSLRLLNVCSRKYCASIFRADVKRAVRFDSEIVHLAHAVRMDELAAAFDAALVRLAFGW